MVKCFLKVKVWDVVIIGGIIIGIIGCFLPWGRLNPSQFQPGQDVRAGTVILSGIYTFMGLTTAAMFQLVFMVKRKVYMIFVVLISGLVALFVSGSWILQPFEYGGSGTYTVLFGAYAALLGAIAVSGMAFLYIAATAEKQRSLSKSKQKI
jgi:hypothetical protein